MPAAATSAPGDGGAPHVALIPSAGMGHLVPFVRLAAALAARGCEVTFVNAHPVVSATEFRHVSDFVASTPGVRPLDFRLLPLEPSTAASTDPFFLHFEAIRRSAHLLTPLLSSASPSLSAVVIDISLASAVLPVTAALSLPSHLLFTASAAMLALCAAFPNAPFPASEVELPGVGALPAAWIPQPLHHPGHLFTTQFRENGRALAAADGVLVNTWAALEPDTLAALNSGGVVPGLPPVTAVGPLPPVGPGRSSDACLPWLDAQPEGSVVYVSFGSRTAMSPEQTRELGVGLERSGCRFLWVVKTKKVDREEDEEEGVEELVGEGYLERVGERGMVVKGWVEQGEVLGHRAVGGFVSHCGWNTVTEAAMRGVRLLAWPRHGDQRLNAWVVERSGLGVWPREWSWEGDGALVGGEEIGRRVRELMCSAGGGAATAVKRVQEEAGKAAGAGGSSCRALEEWVAKLTRAPA